MIEFDRLIINHDVKSMRSDFSLIKVFKTLTAFSVLTTVIGCSQTQENHDVKAQVDYPAYLFASFRGNGEDGLHLAYSRDGLNWTALNNDESVLPPTVGTKLMRDPTLIRGVDGFHMVWTSGWQDNGIGVAHSQGLINWSDQQFVPVMQGYPSARNAWAPEITWDNDAQNYLIFWATTLPGTYPDTEAKADQGWDHRIYATRTADFKAYSDTELYYQPDFNVIDATITPVDNGYVMLVKDETRYPAAKRLHAAFSDSISGPWSLDSEAFSPDGLWVEGPTILPLTLNGEQGYMVYFDAYMNHQFGAMFTKDFKTWEDKTSSLNLPAGTRHGSVLGVTEAELQQLIDAYGDNTTHFTPAQLQEVCTGEPLSCQLSTSSGNYGVAITTSNKFSSVYAESRRLMYAPEVTEQSAPVLHLAVNVRDAEGQPIQDIDEPNVDGLNVILTQSLRQITGIDVTKKAHTRSLFIIGDSTVADQTRQWQKPAEQRYSGWGQMLPAWFGPTITVVNYADSGEGTEAFSVPDGVLWQQMAGQIQSNDWVLIQLGHNDKKTPRDVYVNRMNGLLETIIGQGAHPVLISPMIRNHGIELTEQHIYGDLVLRKELPEIAKQNDVPYIDFMSVTNDWASKLGQKNAQTFFVEKDKTHTNQPGALTFAGFVIEEIKRQQLPLTHYLRATAKQGTGQ